MVLSDMFRIQKEVKYMHAMNLPEIYRAVTLLIDAGFTIPEIENLNQFRKNFQQTSEDLPDTNLHLDLHHLEFIRWMVQTGRISDW